MASFLVETGAAIPGANSLCSVAAADEYHLDRGNVTWTGSNSVKETALREASEYVALEMEARWNGTKKTDTQGMPFPRVELIDRDGYAIPDDIVPQWIQWAVAELALKVLEGVTLLPDRTSPTTLKKKKVKIGPLEQELEYSSGLASPPITTFDKADAFLAPFVSTPGQLRRA